MDRKIQQFFIVYLDMKFIIQIIFYLICAFYRFFVFFPDLIIDLLVLGLDLFTVHQPSDQIIKMGHETGVIETVPVDFFRKFFFNYFRDLFYIINGVDVFFIFLDTVIDKMHRDRTGLLAGESTPVMRRMISKASMAAFISSGYSCMISWIRG